MVEEEKAKKRSIQERKPLRFVEKLETIHGIQQTQSIPARTEVDVLLVRSISFLDFFQENDRHRSAIVKLQSYLRGITVQSKVLCSLLSFHLLVNRSFYLEDIECVSIASRSSR